MNALSSLVLGWGVAAALHLAVGSPLGLPSAAEVAGWVADLNVTVQADIPLPPARSGGSSSSPAGTKRAADRAVGLWP